MSASDSFRVRAVHACREAISVRQLYICGAAFFFAALSSAQDGRAIVSIDYFRTDRIKGDSLHEILPVAIFEDGRFLEVSEWSQAHADRSMRRELLSAHPSVQVLYRGRRIGTLSVSRIYQQVFHCQRLYVGSGDFERNMSQPESDVTDSVRGWFPGERIDYETQSFLALSGAVDDVQPDGDRLVVPVTDPAEIERLTMDVQTVAPRSDLLPLSDDETRAYRLDRYDAVVIVRKRRSAEMLPFPVEGVELKSPLMTDIVVVRTGSGERIVQPLWTSDKGRDSWGTGPMDVFIDAFELEDGAAYLAFERRDNEYFGLRLYRLERSGVPVLVFDDGLYGC